MTSIFHAQRVLGWFSVLYEVHGQKFGRTATVILTSIVTGCGFPDKFRSRAVDYNRSFEQANNDALLLNVLRAAKERPLYFTGFNQIRGAMSAGLGSDVGASFGDDATNAKTNTIISLLTTATYNSSPTFDLITFNNQEFYNGFVMILSASLINFFLIAQLTHPR